MTLEEKQAAMKSRMIKQATVKRVEMEELKHEIIKASLLECRKITLTKEEFNLYRSPLVYVFEHAGRALYIGKSRHGIHRPMHPHHREAAEARKISDTIKFIFCETEEMAFSLERDLIRSLKPVFQCGSSNEFEAMVIQDAMERFSKKA